MWGEPVHQLDNVRKDLTLCYKQIKDIDFAGSCGGTLEPGGTDTIVAYQSKDANARFKGDAEQKAYGWAPIGRDNFFNGTYDGGGCTIAGQLILNVEAALAAEMDSVGFAGGIVGFSGFSDGTISNCTVNGFIGSENANLPVYYLGGIVGELDDEEGSTS